jgi:hypothetical protein
VTTSSTKIKEAHGYGAPMGEMRLELRWASGDHDRSLPIGQRLDVGEATGMTDDDRLAVEVTFPGNANISAEVSSQGKGASGPAVAIVVEIERIGTDIATLIAIGAALLGLIRKVRPRYERDPVIEDPRTLGAVAAAGASGDLSGYRYVSTVPITAYPGIGTNAGDIWAACFAGPDQDGMARVVFMSPTGICLGDVQVPAEMFRDDRGAQHRNPEEIQRLWKANLS